MRFEIMVGGSVKCTGTNISLGYPPYFLGMEEVCKFSRRAHAAGRVGSRLPDRAAACLLASRQA